MTPGELCAEWKRLLAEATPTGDDEWKAVYEGVSDWTVLYKGPRGLGFILIEPEAQLLAWMRNHAEEIIAALEPAVRPAGARP